MADSTAVLKPWGNMTHSEWEANGSVTVHGQSSAYLCLSWHISYSYMDIISYLTLRKRFRTITLSEKNITWAHCEMSYLQELSSWYQLLEHKVLINSANVSLTIEQLLEWNFQLTRTVYQPEAFQRLNRLTSKNLKSKRRGNKTNKHRHQSKPKTHWEHRQEHDKDLKWTNKTQVCRKEFRKRTQRGSDKQNTTREERATQ